MGRNPKINFLAARAMRLEGRKIREIAAHFGCTRQTVYNHLRRTEPKTWAEWQEAVDTAHALLTLDSARQFGLVTGGPSINVDRCVEVLEQGKSRYILPRPDAIERFVEDLTASARPPKP
jgi:hypothetical protein